MKRNLKYTLVLGATLALSFCQGRNASIYDPMNGQNAMTAQQYLNTGTETRALPESMRSQRYSLSYTTAQADACINTAAETGEVSLFCNQIINDYLTKTMGMGYQAYAPENIAITAPNGRVFDYNTADRLSAQNAPWLPQYQAYMGGTDPRASTYFRPAFGDMRSLCGGNGSHMTTVRTNCGNFNWNYGTIVVNGNTGLNYMNRGQFAQAAPIFQSGGTVHTLCKSRCPGKYERVYRRNIRQRNAELEREVNDQWRQLGGIPKRLGLTIVGGLMGIADGVAANIESNINRSLSTVAANQYAQAYNNDQITAYNNMIADQYISATEICQEATVQALAEESPCPDDQLHYVVGDSGGSGNQLRVLKCGS